MNAEETVMSDGEVLNVTLQLKVLAVIQGLQHHVVGFTSTLAMLVATVKTLSTNAKDMSTNVGTLAAKAHSTIQHITMRTNEVIYGNGSATA